MAKLMRTEYRCVCDAYGCRNRAGFAVSIIGERPDLRLCPQCVTRLKKALCGKKEDPEDVVKR